MDFDYNREKDEWLKKNRGIGFEQIIDILNNQDWIDDIKHPNKIKYPKQRIFVIEINNYIFAVPYVYNAKKKIKFLKTIYANSKMKKKYSKK